MHGVMSQRVYSEPGKKQKHGCGARLNWTDKARLYHFSVNRMHYSHFFHLLTTICVRNHLLPCGIRLTIRLSLHNWILLLCQNLEAGSFMACNVKTLERRKWCLTERERLLPAAARRRCIPRTVRASNGRGRRRCYCQRGRFCVNSAPPTQIAIDLDSTWTPHLTLYST